MVIKGALIGSQLLPKEQFIDVFVQKLSQHYNNFKNQLKNISTLVQKNQEDYQGAYLAWEQLQTSLLGNEKVQLLAVTHFYNKDGKQEWKIYDEAQVITSSGIINLQRATKNIQSLATSQIFAKHLSGLFNSLKSEKPSKEMLNKIRKAIQINSYGKDPVFKDAIWSMEEQKTVKYRGQVADAFLQHVGVYHSNYLTSNSNKILKNFSRSAFNEEGPDSWTDRLIESKNRTGWWTGGDLILTDAQGNVIFNLQLKTSAKEGVSIGKISLVEFQKNIDSLINLLDNKNSYKKIAEQFYRMVETSGVVSKVENVVKDTTQTLVSPIENALKRK